MLCSPRFLVALALVGHTQAAFSTRQIYQFPNSNFTEIENVAARSNGMLLLNLATAPATYGLDPTALNPTPELVYKFPEATSVLGIVETLPDVFAIVAGNYSTTTFQGVQGSFVIWSLNLRGPTPKATKIAAIPEAVSLNGMTVVQESHEIVLIADSALGVVWSVDIISGAYQIAIKDPNFSSTTHIPLGINGLHTRGSTLYFTNSAQGLYGSLPITSKGLAAGNSTIITRAIANEIYDDFAFDPSGNVFIANHPNALSEVVCGGIQMIVAGGGNSTILVQPTSAVFGRGYYDQRTLYVVTGGSAHGAEFISGQLVAITPC